MTAALLSSLLSLSFVARFIERHAIRVRLCEVSPDFRFCQWGWHDGTPFFLVKLPSWSCEHDILRNKYGLARRYLMWTADQGWFTGFLWEAP